MHDREEIRKKETVLNIIIKYKSALILLLLCVVVTVLSPRFLNWTNVMNIVRQTTTNGIIAMGMACVIITGGIDLSVGSVLAFSTLITGLLINSGLSGFAAGTIGILLGGIIGILSGILIAELELPPFIVTLASMSVFRGFTMLCSGGMPVGLQNKISFIGAGYIGPIPFPAIVLLIVFLILWFIMNKTKFGRYIYAVGGNEQTARLAGINTKKIKI